MSVSGKFLNFGLWTLIIYNLNLSSFGQFLTGNKIAPIKIHNGGNYAHAQILNAYDFCLS